LAKRKSPYRHTVRNHTRAGSIFVHTYERGKGKPPLRQVITRSTEATPPRKAMPKTGEFSGSYYVQIEYPEHEVESFTVQATSCVPALERGLSQRREFKVPLAVLLRRQ